MYVSQLNQSKVKIIENALRQAITDTGLYTKSEIEEHVQRGLDSKVHDLSDTINIQKILNRNGDDHMNTVQKQPKLFEIHGIYFKDNNDGKRSEVIEDTAFFNVGVDSIIDHQRMWYEEAQKLGYISGELDEDKTIRANYDGEISEVQMIEIVNNSTLMDTPLSELFSTTIRDFLTKS